MSAAERALAKLEMFPSSDCLHAQANEACDCAVDTVSDLAPSLAAVARAGLKRPWYVANVCADCCVARGGWHSSNCRYAESDAALDALEAAAKEVQP